MRQQVRRQIILHPILLTVLPLNEYSSGSCNTLRLSVHFTTLRPMLIGIICFLTINEENDEAGSETAIR